MVWMRWFAHPWALWLLLALPALSSLLAWAAWRRRQALARLGTPFLIERLVRARPRVRRWQSLLTLLGVCALILGVAGPRWGAAAKPDLLGGRDLVIVLDLSRSMLAEQPSRLELAQRSLHDLADTLERRGGHRVALIVFAAHARLQFPLTGDYDHLRFAVDQAIGDAPDPKLAASADDHSPSGTRIGQALRLAAATHDLHRASLQDILLLSDGDDPVGDEEWSQGVQAAHERNIPIHVVAIGDPREPHPIRIGNDVLRHERAVVQTKLNEPLLQEISRRTHGAYFPAYLRALPLGRLLRGEIEGRSRTPAAATDGDGPSLQAAQPRYVWFLFAAFLLLAATMAMSDGARRKGWTGVVVPARLALAMVAIVLVSAEPLASIEKAVRQGNDAFARQQFDEALAWYARAEPLTDDPGLVAFNKGAALFRLGRFDEAAAHYRRCLDDPLIPRERQARANYDLGTALVRSADQDRRTLEESVAALRRCLEADIGEDLRHDATNNLEVAKWLWLKAKPPEAAVQPNTPDEPPEKPALDPKGKNNQAKNAVKHPGQPGQGDPSKNDVQQPGFEGKDKKLAHGPLQVLPDDNKLTPLSPEETAAHLDAILDRIERERRSFRQQAAPAPGQMKDW